MGRLDVVSRWLVATRSAVLVMTFTSAAFAGLLAAKAGKFQLGLWALVTLGLLLAHATNNLINDLTDSWKGVDKDNYFRTQYGPQPLESGLMSVPELLVYIAVTGLAALAIGAETRLLHEVGLFSNVRLFAIVCVSFGLQLAIHHEATLADIFGTSPISLSQCLAQVALGSVPLVALELRKLIRRRGSAIAQRDPWGA